MLRKGERDAAFARLEKNLKIQPLDEYMLAIRHMCEGGIKVTPYVKETSENTQGMNGAANSAKKDILAGVDMNSTDHTEEKKGGLMSKLAGIFGKGKKN